MRRRYAFSAATMLGLMLVLAAAPHAQNQAPPPFPGLPPDIAAMMQERKILAQFDASKDGRLDKSERQAARKWLATQPPVGLAAEDQQRFSSF